MSKQKQEQEGGNRETLAKLAGNIAAAPLTGVGLVCTGVGYVGTGVRKVGESIEWVGFGSAAKVYAYRDALGMKVEDMILGIGKNEPAAEQA